MLGNSEVFGTSYRPRGILFLGSRTKRPRVCVLLFRVKDITPSVPLLASPSTLPLPLRSPVLFPL